MKVRFSIKKNKNQTARISQNKTANSVVSLKSSPSVKYRPLNVYQYRTILSKLVLDCIRTNYIYI